MTKKERDEVDANQNALLMSKKESDEVDQIKQCEPGILYYIYKTLKTHIFIYLSVSLDSSHSIERNINNIKQL